MFDFFKKKKNETEEIVEKKSSEKIGDVDSQIAFLKEQQWISSDFDIKKKNILIMDDRPEIISSVIDDLRSLDESNIFFLNSYNLITISSKMAGFYAMDILEKAPDIEIHYALLDIFLGGKQTINNRKVMVDGVDVALKIYEKFPSADIIFFTGCIVENSDDPSHFKNKFKKHTGENITDYIMTKDISFESELTKLSIFFNGFSQD